MLIAKISLYPSSDEDECLSGEADCHQTLGLCTNVIGNYTCACKPGYMGDGIECEGT